MFPLSPKKDTKNVNKVSRCCLHCRKTPEILLFLYKCSKCKSGICCSKACQKKDIQNHLKTCGKIALEKQEKEKTFRNFSISSDNLLKLKQHLKLVELVGHGPVINFYVGGKNFGGFWDTVSIISLISKEWLNKQFHNIRNFLGYENV